MGKPASPHKSLFTKDIDLKGTCEWKNHTEAQYARIYITPSYHILDTGPAMEVMRNLVKFDIELFGLFILAPVVGPEQLK